MLLKPIRDAAPSVLFCLALFFPALAQDSDVAKKTETIQPSGGHSIVKGRAVYDDTGQPATRERIQLIASEALKKPPSRLRIPTAITNENGEFSLQRITAGEYYVFAQPADEHASSSQLLPFLHQSGDSAADAANVDQFKKTYIRIVVDGQRSLDVNLRVRNPHFGTISGHVFDAVGKPAGRAYVHVISRAEKPFGASIRTDELGQYKIWGLPPGQYTISASPPAKGLDGEESTRRYEGLLGATYFPSTLDATSSPPVTVLSDRDTGNIEVTLLTRSLHNITGTVRMVGDNRPPVTNATLRLSVIELANQSSQATRAAGIDAGMSNYISSTDKNGRWSFANVPDGTYRLFVQPAPGEPTKQPFVQKEMELVVNGADVEDFLVDVSDGGRISGVVSVEGTGSSPQFIRVVANASKGPGNSGVRIDEAGKFTLMAVPSGEITVSAFLVPQDKFYVKSIEANGQDLLRTNVTVAEGEEIKDVHIVISANVGEVTGHVFSSTGSKPLAGVNVMLRRISDDKLRLFGGKLTAVTDDHGNYLVSAAPGVYMVVVWRPADGPSAFGDELNKGLQEQSPAITLGPGDRKQLDLRLP